MQEHLPRLSGIYNPRQRMELRSRRWTETQHSFAANLQPSEDAGYSSICLMSANPINREHAFADAALQHWDQLGRELRADVDQFSRSGRTASFSQPAANEYRVSNSDSGLEVRIVADLDDHIARYDFRRMNDHSAGVPEGGILSMRIGVNGVEFFSSDQPLTAAEARSLLIDPVLNPPNRREV